MCHGTGNAAEALCELFGMWYAKDGTKAVPFDVSVRTLGMHVTLGNAAGGSAWDTLKNVEIGLFSLDTFLLLQMEHVRVIPLVSAVWEACW